jgi:2-polyprenyl-3-methyl-5-hydroxy-6-metoxy-1,4-benzoquinol methylase
MKNIHCPVCNSTQKTMMSLFSKNMKVLGESFPESESFIVTCAECGSVYIDTEATQKHFSTYYDSGYSKTISYYDTFGDNVTNQYFDTIYSCIKKYISSESHIFDMGAGRGEFSVYLINKGYKHVLAAEPSLVNCDYIKNSGINCLYDDTFSTNENLKNTFDLIILSHSLEHVIDFNIALTNVKSMLKKDGVIYIEVPDASKYADVKFPSYFFMTYEHILHLTQKTFENIANVYGITLLESNSYFKCNSYHVINGIFKNNGTFLNVIYTDETKIAVEEYLQYSKKKLSPMIQKLENSQEKLILWGIGASTAQLLNDTFDHCNIIQLIDSNASRQGIEFEILHKTFTVKSPSKLIDKEATIVVLPIMYKNSIISQIQAMGFTNKILTLE